MNTRWVVPTLTLAAAVMLAPACDDDGDGTGGSGGSGATGGGGSSGTCLSGQPRFKYLPGESYVALLNNCPDGSTALDLRTCDACACAKPQPSCVVHGRVYDTNACPINQSRAFADDAVPRANNCVTTEGINPYISVGVHTGTCEAVEDEKLEACTIPSDSGLERIDGACIPEELTLLLGRLCILAEGSVDCATRYPDYPVSTPIYEGGNCGCTCTASGVCSGLTVHAMVDCQDSGFSINGMANCYSATVAQAAAVKVGNVPDCTPSEPSPTGTEKTLCCLGKR